MDLTRIKQTNYLENTVLLYRGVTEMYTLWCKEHSGNERENPQLLWLSFKAFVSGLETDAVAEKGTGNMTVKWRYQNTLRGFFRFLEDEQKMLCRNMVASTVAEDAAKLLCLYDCANAIEEYVADQEKSAYIPYLYERLCNSMRDIAQSDMCYLADLRNGVFTPLATSSFAGKLLDYILDESDFLQIHKLWRLRSCGDRNEQAVRGRPIAGTVFRTEIWKKSARNNHYQRFHILALRLNVSHSEKERYYIVFQTAVTPVEEKDTWMVRPDPGPIDVTNADLKRMRDILFLRATLVKLTEQSLHILVLSQATCRYVLPLGKNNRLTILHLTDLHIKTKNEKDLKKVFECFPEKTSDSPIDLVVITGDVVQGQGSAGELEEHYYLADELLRELAKRLWHYDDTDYLRGDWRKRLAIIPGNHDYAAMNELEVIRQKGVRSTGAGRPAQKEGGPMVKFAYYIHFICQLLGIDMGEQIRDWLNSVRYYDRMGLTLLCLNTSAGAGPLRNNKVHIDPDYVEKLEMTGCFEKGTTICLSHHTFAYKPDYAVDRYYTSSVSLEKTKDYVQRFRKILGYNLKTEQASIEGELDVLYKELTDAEVGPEEAIMADVAYYRENFRNMDNERCEAIRSAMCRDDVMQAADLNSQKTIFERLINAANIKITLGGHIHKARALKDSHCYEGPLFYRSDKDLVEYAVLSLDCAGSKYDWTHYQHKTDGSDVKVQTGTSHTGVPIGSPVLPAP